MFFRLICFILIVILIYNILQPISLEQFKNKPLVIFLFTGNARSSPFAHNPVSSSKKILDSYDRYIFTDEFKSHYDYKVYMSSDNIHLENTKKYFSNHIGNIHLLETDFYLHTSEIKTKDVQIYLEEYNKKDWSSHQKYDNSIYQHHKIIDSYNLFLNDNIQCDYVVRLRFDIEFNKDIVELLDNFKKFPELQLLLDWDIFAIGKPDIMKTYCTGLENNYGNYNYNVKVGKDLPVMKDYHEVDRHRWTYAPERQLFEMLYDYCLSNNLDINKTIHSMEGASNIVRTEESMKDYFQNNM